METWNYFSVCTGDDVFVETGAVFRQFCPKIMAVKEWSVNNNKSLQ
jgi:hypothetical protein